MLDLQHVRFFVVLAEELNYGRAAARLNISQPPLSRHIQKLEHHLGVKLFERSTRRVVLTPAGVIFRTEAKLLLDQAETSVLAVRQAARALEGSLTIGFVGASTYDFLPRMITAARLELPNIGLDLIQMESAEQETALLAGQIDVGLSRPMGVSPVLDSFTVARDAMVLAAPQSHTLAGRRRLTLDLINGEDFIMFSPAARYLHDMLTHLFDEHTVSPNVVQHLTHSQTILSLVSAGLGIAIVPSVAHKACFDNVVFRRLDISSACQAELKANWKRENLNPALPAFRALLARLPLTRTASS